MASFQAKIGQEGSRKREKRKNRSDEFLPNPEQGIPKKIKKIKKHLYDFFSSQNRLEMAVNE